ncbi:unnamed protein product [Lactuca saligna]|uniref:Uncharacterized protein n=1 Tax=Lactuca saligna TaxID=75948 RepID=A0AA35UWU1_LACSI|nr:unnamed protein product [Lactuca saligna]
MMQAGAIVGPIDRSVLAKSMAPRATLNDVHDLNVPYEGPEEYETYNANLLFPLHIEVRTLLLSDSPRVDEYIKNLRMSIHFLVIIGYPSYTKENSFVENTISDSNANTFAYSNTITMNSSNMFTRDHGQSQYTYKSWRVLMDLKMRASSQLLVVRTHLPQALVVPDFLLAVGEFFCPIFGSHNWKRGSHGS